MKEYKITQVYYSNLKDLSFGRRVVEVEVNSDDKKPQYYHRVYKYSEDRLHSNDIETLASNVAYVNPFKSESKFVTEGLPCHDFYDDPKKSYVDENGTTIKHVYQATPTLLRAFEGMLQWKSKGGNPRSYVPGVFNSYLFLDD